MNTQEINEERQDIEKVVKDKMENENLVKVEETKKIDSSCEEKKKIAISREVEGMTAEIIAGAKKEAEETANVNVERVEGTIAIVAGAQEKAE